MLLLFLIPARLMMLSRAIVRSSKKVTISAISLWISVVLSRVSRIVSKTSFCTAVPFFISVAMTTITGREIVTGIVVVRVVVEVVVTTG